MTEQTGPLSQEEIRELTADIERRQDGQPTIVRTFTPFSELNSRQRAAWARERLEVPVRLTMDEEKMIRKLFSSELSSEERDLYRKLIDTLGSDAAARNAESVI